ncbi:DUF317 domain-containing protein [Streptomyces achromogenes]|uniref:DUF317 domain-containing protein n=1 Tax=Streptomyces achromogenes TaxID=67255 RepID=UPI0036F809F0
MTEPVLDAHVRLDTHPTHPSAATATVTGTGTGTDRALSILLADGWEAAAENTLVLVRIDHDEPYRADKTAGKLHEAGIATEISNRLRKAILAGWTTWDNHPDPWLTPSEIREMCDQAQEIYDDIRHGRLLIHAHAHDGHTTVAVGTYLDTGKSVYLRGENHLRQVADTFDSPAQALTVFERVHGDSMRPGPAPLTDTERQTEQARAFLGAPDAGTEPSAVQPEPVPEPEVVPSYAADPGDHDALLEEFLSAHGEWQKWSTWSDDTTHAIHESQTLRIERVHEADPQETSWTVAAYETPVSERMWHLTATDTAPAPVLQALLDQLADTDTWETALGSPITDKTVTEATRPLTDFGWKHTMNGRWIRWETPQKDAGVQFDAFAAQNPGHYLPTWTLWAGHNPDHPTWAIHASTYTPAALLSHLTGELADGIGIRQPRPPRAKKTHHYAPAPPTGTPQQPPAQLRR